MVSVPWHWPGSRWWRVDLHVHTPSSYDFRSSSDHGSTDWRDWLAAARDAGLQAVAITDHNTAEAVGHLQAVASEVPDAPVLFPGVELTTSNGVHLLLILDPERQQQHVEGLLARAGIPFDQQGRETSRSSLNVEGVLKEFADEALVIGAHANGPCGVLGLAGLERIGVLSHAGLAAVEVTPHSEPEDGWLDGSRPEVGRLISKVWSSDAHRAEQLGRRFTWVKMTRPDLEGLRLALMDGADSLRVATSDDAGHPNDHADLTLESVTVRNGKYIGRQEPTRVSFNPWLNAIIGGRGTGKSTLVDFCRKTLRREAELDDSGVGEEGSLRQYFESRLSISQSRTDEGLLTEDTSIDIVYRKDGDRFVISWSPGGDSDPIARLDGTDRVPQRGRIGDRFPVRIYSQKQLFALARDPNALLTVIDESRNVQGEDLNSTIEQAGSRYLSLCAQIREVGDRTDALPDLEAKLEDIQRKLAVLQEGGHAQILRTYRIRRQQDATWQTILENALQAVDGVEESADELFLVDLDIEDKGEDDPALSELLQGYEILERSVRALRLEVRKAAVRTRRDIEKTRSGAYMNRWREALSASETAFREASTDLAEQGIDHQNQYPRLLEQAAVLKQEIQNLHKGKAVARRLADDAAVALAEYRTLREQLSDKRELFARETSSDMIRVSVNRYANRENLAGTLIRLLGTSHFERDRMAMAERIRGNARRPWDWDDLDREVAAIRRMVAGEAGVMGTRDRRFAAALKRLPPERIDRLALYLPEDSVTVCFRDNPASVWRTLTQGSPGQQTAALLSFVLGYGDEPIILDQPEDDLDSTLIYDLLVSRIRETKLRRQIVVVTHNPNIVVHGDAEMVLSLRAEAGQTHISCEGGLQERPVRDEICAVMEGGREAFEHRYKRIMTPQAPGI